MQIGHQSALAREESFLSMPAAARVGTVVSGGSAIAPPVILVRLCPLVPVARPTVARWSAMSSPGRRSARMRSSIKILGNVRLRVLTGNATSVW
jgi:hypothetical protein